MDLHIRLQTAFICCLSSIAAAQTCQPRPMRIPVDDVILSNNARMRGAAVAVGTPPQNISFTMSNVRNETYVFGRNGACPDFAGRGHLWCQSWRGGMYEPKNSSTGVTDPLLAYEKGDGRKDVLSGPDFEILDAASFAIAQTELDDPYETQAQLGLGLNSSLLHELKDAGKIGSRSYSVYQGREGSDKAQGSLVLGGFDQALVGTAKNYTRNLIYEGDCNSGIRVTFSKVVLNFRNGTDASLFETASGGLSACLKPSFPGLMTMPPTHWKRFQELTDTPEDLDRTYDINYRSVLQEAGTAYDGDLSFTLEGVTIRIPNSELVVPEKYIDKVTGERKENTTKDELVISPLGNGFNNANDVAIMGRLFFSMAYLSINQDAGTFTVWPVEDSFSSGTPSIKALSPENNIVEDFCDGENPPASNGTETRQPSNEKKSSLSGAALGGIVLGGLAFIAAILALILFFLRGKKRANKGNRLEGNEGANSSQLPPYRAGQYYDAPSEMPASAGPAEAPPLTTKYAYNLELEAPTQPQELDGSHGRAL